MQKLKSNANSTSNGINNSFSKTGSNIGQSISKGTSTAQANINKLNSAVNNFNNQAGLGFNRTGNTIGQSISKGSNTGTSALSKLSSIGNSIFSTISSGASKAGTTIGNGLSKGASIGTQALSKLGSVGKSAVSGIASQFEGLNGVIAGAIGGFGLYEIGQAAWTGATQKQFNQAYLATKMSDSAAKGYVQTINDIVAKVPGDDTFMSTLLSGAVARQTNLSTDQLVTLGNAVADYTITSQAMGKSMIETQMDLKEYIQTGNTSQLERDSILKNQLDTLEDQKTVGDRILALDKALKEEGYKGLSQLDIATIKTEELKGKIQAGLTELGTSALPVVEDIVDGLNKADESTDGLSTKALTIGGIVTAMAAPAIMVAQKLHEAYKWARQTIDLGGAGGKSKAMRIGASILVAVTLAYVFTGIMGYSNTQLGKVMKEDMKSAVKKQNTKYLSSGIGKQIVEIPIIGQLVLESFTFGGNLGALLNGTGGSELFKEYASEIQLNLPLSLGLTLGQITLGNSGGEGFNMLTFVDDIKKMLAEYFVSNVMTFDISVTPSFSVDLTQFNSIKTKIINGWNSLKSLIGNPIVGTIQILSGPIVNTINTVIDLYNLVTGGSIGHVTVNDDGSIGFTKSKVENTYSTTKQGASGNVSVSSSGLPGVLGNVIGLYNTVTGGASGTANVSAPTVTGVLNNVLGLYGTTKQGASGNVNVNSGSVNIASAKTTTLYGKVRGGSKGNVTVGTSSVTTGQAKTNSFYNIVRAGANGAIRIATSSVSSALSAVRSLYNTVRNGASGVISIVKKVTGGGPAGPAHNIHRAMGSGPFDNLNLNYESYEGFKHSPFVNGGLSGNCVDMSMGLLALNGGKGKIVDGTWNGGPHVWYQDPSGRNWDPARKALVGTWNPPARGPNESNNNNYNTVVVEMKDNTIYGERDFTDKIKKIAQNTFYNEVEVNQATGH